MSRQILIGLIAEGNTDKDFLPGIITRVYQSLENECRQQPEVMDIRILSLSRKDLPAYLVEGARMAYDAGLMILCVHVDADNRSDKTIREGKLAEALNAVGAAEGGIVKVIVPAVPVRTLENWMLADRSAFKKAIGTALNNQDLGIHHPPEYHNDPKAVIKKAIRAHNDQKSGRRSSVDIKQLYAPLGQTASLTELRKLPSFQKFYAAARQSLIELGLIVPE